MKTNFFNKWPATLILGFALFTMMLSSCKKDDDANDGGFVIRFKANDTLVEFKEQASLVAAFGKSGVQHNAAFSGGENLSNIVLQVFDSKDIESATYTGFTISGSSVVGALISYSDKTGTNYTQGSIGSNVTITISEITTTAVRGTFSGTVKATGKPDIALTQGEFFVWRAN